MDADRFCKEFEERGAKAHSIDDVIDNWELHSKQRTADDFLGMEALISILVADAATGDGLLDQISPELLEAFTARRGQSLDSYDEIRSYLQEMLARGDHSVGGVVNQIKGQIGELVFREEAGGHAYLARATNQEAWDVAIPQPHGATEYIQVKIYQSADQAVEKMLEVQRKVDAGSITDGSNAVHHINFAVNEDIVDAVRAKAALHPGLSGIDVYSIPLSNSDATGIVVDGFNNVGPDELVHLFDEWFGGTLTAACLHGMANAFLVYKGSKTISAATESTLTSTAITAPAVAAAQATAWLVTKTQLAFLSGHPVIAAVAAGMLTRAVTKQWYESREATVSVINREIRHTKMLHLALSNTSP
jgi:hypothetical protein